MRIKYNNVEPTYNILRRKNEMFLNQAKNKRIKPNMKQINWVKNKTFTRRENGSYDSALHVIYGG